MSRRARLLRGFTIIELMVVVAIVVILAAIGTMSLTSRFATARVEEAARTLAADLSYARSAAMFKGCRTRLTYCPTKTCVGEDVDIDGVGGVLSVDGAPARAYALLRMSQEANNQPCFNSNAIPEPTDEYANWDYERKPQGLPRGTVLGWIFSNAQERTWDWAPADMAPADAEYNQVTNSLYFNKDGSVFSPSGTVTVGTAVHDILAQVQPEDCNPTDDDCFGIFVTVSPAGVVSTMRCTPGGRGADPDDGCY